MGGSPTQTVNYKPTVTDNARMTTHSIQNGRGSNLNFDPHTSQNGRVSVDTITNSGRATFGLQNLNIVPNPSLKTPFIHGRGLQNLIYPDPLLRGTDGCGDGHPCGWRKPDLSKSPFPVYHGTGLPSPHGCFSSLC